MSDLEELVDIQVADFPRYPKLRWAWGRPETDLIYRSLFRDLHL